MPLLSTEFSTNSHIFFFLLQQYCFFSCLRGTSSILAKQHNYKPLNDALTKEYQTVECLKRLNPIYMLYIKQDVLKELTLAEQYTEVYGFHLTTSEGETGSVRWG